jgi:predicted  nucleic acid-binding Zn-ribbon protein
VDDVTREAFLRSQLQEVADNLVRVQEASKPSWIAIRDFRKQLIDLRRELDEHLAEINKTQEEEIPSNDETLAAIAQIMTNDLSLAQLETIAKLAMTRIGWSQ